MTNGDKIRQMTDEKLAHTIMPNNYTPCPVHMLGEKDCQEDCTECVLEWLRQEAEE